MSLETRSTDAKGRISLPKAFVNATVIPISTIRAAAKP
jgi:hypothetical protein